jgi:hypothetical protein
MWHGKLLHVLVGAAGSVRMQGDDDCVSHLPIKGNLASI